MSIISHKNLQFNKDWDVNKPNSSSSARITTCFIFICLINKSSSDSSLSLTTKRVKLKYNIYIYIKPELLKFIQFSISAQY